jgi:pimeloyl-ACP methyl ester carboxylesterase
VRALFFIGFRLPLLRRPLLLRAFCSPFPGGLRRTEPDLAPHAVREEWLYAASPFRLWRFGHGPKVFLVHGWAGHPLQMMPVAKLLADQGFEAVVIELPAHGASPGRQTHGIAAARALLEVERELGSPRVIVAHSFGCLATRIAVGFGLSPGRLIFVAPLPSLRFAARDFAAKVHVSAQAMVRLAESFVRGFGLDMEEIALSADGAHFELPLLVVHDRGDRVIPFTESEQIVGIWPGSTLLATEDLGHTRILADPLVQRSVVDFASSDSEPLAIRAGA